MRLTNPRRSCNSPDSYVAEDRLTSLPARLQLPKRPKGREHGRSSSERYSRTGAKGKEQGVNEAAGETAAKEGEPEPELGLRHFHNATEAELTADKRTQGVHARGIPLSPSSFLGFAWINHPPERQQGWRREEPYSGKRVQPSHLHPIPSIRLSRSVN